MIFRLFVLFAGVVLLLFGTAIFVLDGAEPMASFAPIGMILIMFAFVFQQQATRREKEEARELQERIKGRQRSSTAASYHTSTSSSQTNWHALQVADSMNHRGQSESFGDSFGSYSSYGSCDSSSSSYDSSSSSDSGSSSCD